MRFACTQPLRYREVARPDSSEKRPGTLDARPSSVAGVGRFEDLHVWRLSVEIRDAISRLTDSGKAARDFDFRDQIRGASSSAPRNIAEGFGRFRPKPFASFLRIARGSLHETRNLLHEARSKKYFEADEVETLLRLQARASKAAVRLIKYLETLPDDFDVTSRAP